MLTKAATDIGACIVCCGTLLESPLWDQRSRCWQRRSVEELGHNTERLLRRRPTPLVDVATPFDNLGLDGTQGAAQGHTKSALHVGGWKLERDLESDAFAV